MLAKNDTGELRKPCLPYTVECLSQIRIEILIGFYWTQDTRKARAASAKILDNYLKSQAIAQKLQR